MKEKEKQRKTINTKRIWNSYKIKEKNKYSNKELNLKQENKSEI